MRRFVFVLACLAVPYSVSAQVIAPYSTNVTMPAFIVGSTTGASTLLFYPDNTYDIGATGANRPKDVYIAGALSAGGNATVGALFVTTTNRVGSSTLGTWSWTADGTARLQNQAQTIGAQFKVDALPVASACGAGSPAVVAGSTPMSGSVTIGTTSVATCTITFGGTAFPGTPHCSGAVETTTAANVRAMGYSASTTVLTIVPSAAWVDSSVVNWVCFSSK